MAPGRIDPSRRRAGRTGGFTLVEMIVVTVVLLVLSGMVMVRMVGTSRRRVDVTIRSVEHVLETLAHRQVVGQDRLALHYDEPTNALRLLWLRMRDDGETISWDEDPLVRPVLFDESIAFGGLFLNGDAVREYPVELPGDQVRPVIDVAVEYEDSVEYVTLLPHGMRAIRRSDDSGHAGPEPVDLDAVGEGEQSW